MKINITPKGLNESHGKDVCDVQMPLVVQGVNVGDALKALLGAKGTQLPTTAPEGASDAVKALEQKVEKLTDLVKTLTDGLVALKTGCDDKKGCLCTAVCHTDSPVLPVPEAPVEPATVLAEPKVEEQVLEATPTLEEDPADLGVIVETVPMAKTSAVATKKTSAKKGQ